MTGKAPRVLPNYYGYAFVESWAWFGLSDHCDGPMGDARREREVDQMGREMLLRSPAHPAFASVYKNQP